MDSKTTISISEARKRIFEIAKKVQHPNIFFTLTEKGSPKAVIMSADEFESWLETLEVSREFPDLKENLDKVAQDVATGRVKDYISVDKLADELKNDVQS